MGYEHWNVAPPTRASLLLSTRIIVIALMIGSLTFAAVVLFMRSTQRPMFIWDVDTFSAALLAAAAMAIVMSFIVPSLVARQPLLNVAPDAPDDAFWTRFQTATIVRAAPLEASAFCSLIAVMIAGCAWGLVFAGVALLLMLVLCLPSEGRLDAFIDSTRRKLRDSEDLARLRRV